MLTNCVSDLISQIYLNCEVFLEKVFFEADRMNLSLSDLIADHVCFRVETQAEYEIYKNEFLSKSNLLTEELVNGRLICTFEFQKPFVYKNHKIYLLELPQPKMNSPYKTGFEHIEFVLTTGFKTFQNRNNHLSFKVSGHKNLNPELVLKLNSGQIKFHYQPLDRVIQIEKAHIQNILFDLDGTLIKSHEVILQVNSQVFTEVLGRNVSVEESKEKYQTEFSKLFEAYGLTTTQQKQLAVLRWSQISMDYQYSFFDGAFEFLELLKQKKINIHLWTARDKDSTLFILKSLGIESFFETISFSNEQGSKPDTSNLNFNWTDQPINSLLMIGDSRTDMNAGKNIKAITAAALWDPNASEDILVSHRADLYFYKVSELSHWFITQLNKINN